MWTVVLIETEVSVLSDAREMDDSCEAFREKTKHLTLTPFPTSATILCIFLGGGLATWGKFTFADSCTFRLNMKK